MIKISIIYNKAYLPHVKDTFYFLVTGHCYTVQEIVVDVVFFVSTRQKTYDGKPASATKTSSLLNLLSSAINFSRAQNFDPFSDLQNTTQNDDMISNYAQKMTSMQLV